MLQLLWLLILVYFHCGQNKSLATSDVPLLLPPNYMQLLGKQIPTAKTKKTWLSHDSWRLRSYPDMVSYTSIPVKKREKKKEKKKHQNFQNLGNHCNAVLCLFSLQDRELFPCIFINVLEICNNATPLLPDISSFISSFSFINLSSFKIIKILFCLFSLFFCFQFHEFLLQLIYYFGPPSFSSLSHNHRFFIFDF